MAELLDSIPPVLLLGLILLLACWLSARTNFFFGPLPKNEQKNKKE